MRLKAPLKVLWIPDTNVDDMLSSFAAKSFVSFRVRLATCHKRSLVQHAITVDADKDTSQQYELHITNSCRSSNNERFSKRFVVFVVIYL